MTKFWTPRAQVVIVVCLWWSLVWFDGVLLHGPPGLHLSWGKAKSFWMQMWIISCILQTIPALVIQFTSWCWYGDDLDYQPHSVTHIPPQCVVEALVELLIHPALRFSKAFCQFGVETSKVSLFVLQMWGYISCYDSSSIPEHLPCKIKSKVTSNDKPKWFIHANFFMWQIPWINLLGSIYLGSTVQEHLRSLYQRKYCKQYHT